MPATVKYLLNLPLLMLCCSSIASTQQWQNCQQTAMLSDSPNQSVLHQLWLQHDLQDLVLLNNHVYTCPCLGMARLDGDAERSRLAGDAEQSRLAGAAEQSRLAGAADNARLGGANDAARLGGNSDAARLGGDSDSARLGGTSDQARLGGDSDQSRLAGQADQSRLAGGAEQARLGGDSEAARLGGSSAGLRCTPDATSSIGYRVQAFTSADILLYDGQHLNKL